MRKFKDYDVWKNSMNLVEEVYLILEKFPNTEKYNLKSQMSRSAVSIPSNIAEGCSRNSKKEFCRFLEIALGSAFELETQSLLSIKIGIINKVELVNYLDLLNKIQRQLNSLIQKIKADR